MNTCKVNVFIAGSSSISIIVSLIAVVVLLCFFLLLSIAFPLVLELLVLCGDFLGAIFGFSAPAGTGVWSDIYTYIYAKKRVS